MSIGHLLDHTARVWRPVESLGSRRETVRTYVVHIEAIAAACTRKRGMISQSLPSGGTVVVGNRMLYTDIPADIRERDIVELLSGSYAPARLEIESVSRPRDHHLEATATQWHGQLPPIVEGS